MSTNSADHEAHWKECMLKAGSQCENCGRPMFTILQTPMSWLHIVHDPFVHVWVTPVCGSGQCEVELTQHIQQAILQAPDPSATNGTATNEPNTTEILPCKACQTTTGTKRRARCKVVAYCGREHQKQDWTAHKKACAALRSGSSIDDVD